MSKISFAMCSTVGLLSVLKIGSPSASSGATSGSSNAQDHLVVQLAVDPALHDALDVGEIHHHVAVVELGRADVHFDDGVVAVRMLADAVVVEQPMTVAEVDALGDQIHRLTVTYAAAGWPTSAVLFSGGLDSAVLLAQELTRADAVWPIHVRSGLAWEAAEARAIARLLAAPPFAGRVASADHAHGGHARRSIRPPTGPSSDSRRRTTRRTKTCISKAGTSS